MSAWLLIFVSLTGRFWVGLALAAMPVIALAVSNHMKIAILGEPVTPDDLRIVKDVVPLGLRIMPSLKVILPAAVVVLVAAAFVLDHWRPLIHWSWRKRILIGAISAAFVAAVPLCEPALADLGCFEAVKWDWGESYRRDGLALSFVAHARQLVVRERPPAPAGYGPEMMHDVCQRVLSGYTPASPPAKPPDIVIAVMESMADISHFTNVHQSVDCLAHLHRLQDESGKLTALSPTFGGGSVNADFEVCTGLALRFLPHESNVAIDVIDRDMPSVPRFLRANGYDTIAMVPAPTSLFRYGWFFQSGTGFEHYMDMKSFGGEKLDDMPDGKMAQRVLDVLNNTSGRPKFIYAQFLRNHIPWSGKFNHPEVVPSHNLSGADRESFNNYAQGVYEADLALGKLADGLRRSSRPAVLVVFGDHVPPLGGAALQVLGAIPGSGASEPDVQLRRYSTPCVVWSNRPGARFDDGVIGMNLLAGRIATVSGYSHPYYTHFLTEVYSALHGLNREVVITKTDAAVHKIPPDAQALIEDYKAIQYDMLFGAQYAKKSLFPDMTN
jgi:hypothetical protein